MVRVHFSNSDPKKTEVEVTVERLSSKPGINGMKERKRKFNIG